jgi:hypothetical protein
MLRHGISIGLVVLGLGAARSWAGGECDQRPSRASDAYWKYLERCGCNDVPAVSSASADYDKWTAACQKWRLDHPQPAATPAPSPSPVASPAASVKRRRSPDCASAPSRSSSSYWSYLERCGCEDAEPVSGASPDYDRWAAACDEWKKKNAYTEKP